MKQHVVNIKKTHDYDVYIGRPSKWGNMYSHLPGTLAKYKVDSRQEALDSYKEWVYSQPELLKQIKLELKDKVLGCFCFPLPCHGDLLAKIANE